MNYLINKAAIQRSLDAVVKEGKYNEEYGQQVLALSDLAVLKRGLYYRHTEFEVNYVIKPKIVDDLLLKCFKYDSSKAKAYTFLNTVITTAILDAVRKIRQERYGDATDVFYYENIKEVLRKELEVEDDAVWDIEVVYEIISNKKSK